MMKMSKAEEDILEEVKYYQERFFAYDEPVPFCGMYIYPIKVRNYNEFLTSNICFNINKNDDPKGVIMTHLDYLISKMNEEEQGRIWTFKFQRLLELVFHIQNGLKCPKCGKFMTYEEFIKKFEDVKNGKSEKNPMICDCGEQFREQVTYKKDKDSKKTSLWVDGNEITAKDFQRLRRIVMYQNLPDFKDDSWVHKAVRDDQAARNELLSRGQGSASIEKKIVCVSAQSNYKIEEIYDLSIRKFLMLLTTVDDVITYTSSRMAMATGLVSFKNHPIEHWIYKKDRGLYDAAVDSDSFKQQITNAQS